MLPDTLGAWHILYTVSLWQGQLESHKFNVKFKNKQENPEANPNWPDSLGTNKQKFSYLFDVFTIF